MSAIRQMSAKCMILVLGVFWFFICVSCFFDLFGGRVLTKSESGSYFIFGYLQLRNPVTQFLWQPSKVCVQIHSRNQKVWYLYLSIHLQSTAPRKVGEQGFGIPQFPDPFPDQACPRFIHTCVDPPRALLDAGDPLACIPISQNVDA